MKLTTQETERMIAKVSGGVGTEDSRDYKINQVRERGNDEHKHWIGGKKKDIDDWNTM